MKQKKLINSNLKLPQYQRLIESINQSIEKKEIKIFIFIFDKKNKTKNNAER